MCCFACRGGTSTDPRIRRGQGQGQSQGRGRGRGRGQGGGLQGRITLVRRRRRGARKETAGAALLAASPPRPTPPPQPLQPVSSSRPAGSGSRPSSTSLLSGAGPATTNRYLQCTYNIQHGGAYSVNSFRCLVFTSVSSVFCVCSLTKCFDSYWQDVPRSSQQAPGGRGPWGPSF